MSQPIVLEDITNLKNNKLDKLIEMPRNQTLNQDLGFGNYHFFNSTSGYPDGYTNGDNDFVLQVISSGVTNTRWQTQILTDIRSGKIFKRAKIDNTYGNWKAIDNGGDATTATKLQTPRTIKIGATGKLFDGSADVSWNHAELGTGRAFSAWVNFGNAETDMKTSDFISLLRSFGAFSQPYWVCRGSWSYANNRYITDTGCGNIHLAGCTVEVIGNENNYTIRIHTPTTTAHGTTNAEFIYVNNGSGYSPGWRRIYSTGSKPTPSEIGALPATGGLMTGPLNLANNTWNFIGDDVYMGDCNVAGCLGIKGANGHTGIYFAPYSGDRGQKIYSEGNGNLVTDGNFRASGELITHHPNGLRMIQGNQSFFIRNDSSNTYFMFSNPGDPFGIWNGLRPLVISNSTGNLSSGHALTIGNSNGNVKRTTISTASPSGGANNDIWIKY